MPLLAPVITTTLPSIRGMSFSVNTRVDLPPGLRRPTETVLATPSEPRLRCPKGVKECHSRINHLALLLRAGDGRCAVVRLEAVRPELVVVTTFDGDVPHGPEALIKLPIVMLAVMVYPNTAKIKP